MMLYWSGFIGVTLGVPTNRQLSQTVLTQGVSIASLSMEQVSKNNYIFLVSNKQYNVNVVMQFGQSSLQK